MPEQMSEKEYRKHPALNFSSLASFYNKGVYSPDHALIKLEYKSYFEFGKMFETILQDSVQGTDEFGKRFYFTELENKMPDDLIKWIDNKEDLTEYYVFKKDGGRSATFKGQHAYLDEAVKNPGKIPVSKKDGEMLKRLTDNMLKMEYLDAKVEDILSKAEWQKPIIWTDEVTGFECKALLDCVVDLGGEFLAIDIKTTADFKQFGYMLSDKLFLQDIHYIEGVNACMGPAMPMVFFVASKTAPFLCQPWAIDYGDMDWRVNAIEEYRELCKSYKKWNDDGRWSKGWLPLELKKLYLK